MSNYIITAENTSNEVGNILADVGFSYTNNLNEINQCNLKISGTSASKRSLIEMGSIIRIYRNTTLEFKGLVDKVDYLSAGGMSILASGWEIWLGKENGDYANSPWDNTASATIFSAILGESNYFTAGTVETGTDIDFRLALTDSLWNAISNLKNKIPQDIGIDYTNDEIDILDHKGSTTSVATFNSDIQMNNIRVTQTYPIGNDVRVYGKGNGDNQIKSNFTTAGQDATSKSTYGIIRKIIRDPSVLTIDEADLLANSNLAIFKDPVKIYDFNVINPNQSVVSGDVITLNAKSQGLTNEEVRVVGISKGFIGSKEFLTYQVTNKEYSQKINSQGELLGRIEKIARDNDTYMQGTTNILTFSDQINADSTAGLKIIANLSDSEIFDEAGKRRVNSFTLDYDVDEYRRGVGTASEDNVAPGVAGSSSNTQPGVSGNSGSTAPSVTGSSASAPAFVTVTSTTFTNVSCSSGSWTTLASRTAGNFDENVDGYANATIYESSGGPEDLYFRIYNTYLSSVEYLTYIDNFGSGSTESGTFGITGTGISFLVGATYYALQCMPITGAIVLSGGFEIDEAVHTHGDGTYAAVSHPHADGSYYTNSHLHADGSYAAASHNHSVAIGDAVSDAASTNASEVNIYLDFWNTGTSAWDNKHSVLTTGKTLDTNVDISDGDTYPDVAGFWRVRILTDNASPDLVKGIIKCKHELDN